MANMLFTNNASSTLASSINSSVTSLTVAAGQGSLFPSPTGSQYFYCTLSNLANTLREIVKVTARSTDTFTIVRGQDNTTAQSWAAGDSVELRLTAADLQNFGQLDSANTWASGQVFVAPVLGTPASATLTNATGLPVSTGISGLGGNVASFLAVPSSANLASAMTDETGSGSLVFANSPALVTPNLGTPSTLTLTNATGLPLSTGVTGTLPTTNGGTGLTTVGTANQVLTSNGTNLSYSKVGIANLSATGTADSTTYLRGDNTWQTISLSGYATTGQAVGSLSYAGGSSARPNYMNYYRVNGTFVATVQTADCNCNC